MSNDEPHRQYEQGRNPRSNIPVPDPSALTTEALDREVGHLQQLLEAQIKDNEKDLDQFKQEHDRRHLDFTDRQLENLQSICEIKFDNVKTRFDERDLRFQQGSEAASAAIQAALTSAKEAVAKSEAAFTKEIDGLKELISSQAKATDQMIRDIKDELAATRGKGAGMDKAWGIAIAAIGIIIAVISVFVRFGTGG